MRELELRQLLDLDKRITERIRIYDSGGLLRHTAIIFAHSGDSWFILLGLSMIWFFGDQEWKVTTMTMAAGVILTAGVVFILKFTIRRERPVGDWGNIYRKTDPHSFPSGHAARVTMLATIAIAFGPLWFGVLLALWAPLVILARVVMGVHYLFDVIAGAVVGIGTGIATLLLTPYLIEFISQSF